jgi:hypothetical protein
MRIVVEFPQTLADQHTLIAQRYAGYFAGHMFRAQQQRVGPGAIRLDASKPWPEPMVTSDGCDFCEHLTDDDAERRVAGYQHAIDIEVLRPHALAYATWLGAGGQRDRAAMATGGKRQSVNASASDRRAFIVSHADILQVRPLPLIDLPLRLKRKLCIEWNHLYRDWLRDSPGLCYDFERREFYRDVDEPLDEPQRMEHWWQDYRPARVAARRRR